MDRLFVQVKLKNKKWKDIKWKLMKSCKQLKLDWRERNKTLQEEAELVCTLRILFMVLADNWTVTVKLKCLGKAVYCLWESA